MKMCLVLMATVTTTIANQPSTIDSTVSSKMGSSQEYLFTHDDKDMPDTSKVYNSAYNNKDISEEKTLPSGKQLAKNAVDVLISTPKMEREQIQTGSYHGFNHNHVIHSQPFPHQTGTKK